MLLEEKIAYASIIEIKSLEAVKQYMAEGIGLALMPEMAGIEEIREKRMSNGCLG